MRRILIKIISDSGKLNKCYRARRIGVNKQTLAQVASLVGESDKRAAHKKNNKIAQNIFSSASGSFLTTLRTDDDVTGRRGGVYLPSTFPWRQALFRLCWQSRKWGRQPSGADLHLSEWYLILIAPPVTWGERLSGGGVARSVRDTALLSRSKDEASGGWYNFQKPQPSTVCCLHGWQHPAVTRFCCCCFFFQKCSVSCGGLLFGLHRNRGVELTAVDVVL